MATLNILMMYFPLQEKYEIDGDTNNEAPTYAPFKARTTDVRIMSHLEVCCAGQFVNLPRGKLPLFSNKIDLKKWTLNYVKVNDCMVYLLQNYCFLSDQGAKACLDFLTDVVIFSEELHNLLDSLGARVVQEPSMFTYDEGLEQIILVDSSEPNFDQKKMISK